MHDGADNDEGEEKVGERENNGREEVAHSRNRVTPPTPFNRHA
jgi:hypothetical protein